MFKKIMLTMLVCLLVSSAAISADRLKLLGAIGSKGSIENQMNYARDIFIDKRGNILAADYSNHRILKFGPDGKLKLEFGEFGAKPGQLAWPQLVTMDNKGNIFVVDYHDMSLDNDPKADRAFYYRVQKFSPEGDHLWTVGGAGSGNSQFNGSPTDIVADSENNIYVVDRGNYRIQKFDPNGRFLYSIGSYGKGDGQFDSPTYLMVDDDSNLYVSDNGNFRVQKFDKRGKYLLSFGKEGYNDGELSYMYQMYLDKNGMISIPTTFSSYTSSKRRQIRLLVQKFDRSGKFVSKRYAFERFYDDDTSYYFNLLNFDRDDNVYLFHSRDKSINKYSFKPSMNFESMTKTYSLELRNPVSRDTYNYSSYTSTSTSENITELSGISPVQNLYFYYEKDDKTTVTLSNTLTGSFLNGTRDEKSFSGTLAWASWEGIKNSFGQSTSLSVRHVFDKTKNKDWTLTLGFSNSQTLTEWTKKAPRTTTRSFNSAIYSSLNFDINDFSNIEVGYNKSDYPSDYDYLYNGYRSLYGYPSSYGYIKYYADF